MIATSVAMLTRRILCGRPGRKVVKQPPDVWLVLTVHRRRHQRTQHSVREEHPSDSLSPDLIGRNVCDEISCKFGQSDAQGSCILIPIAVLKDRLPKLSNISPGFSGVTQMLPGYVNNVITAHSKDGLRSRLASHHGFEIGLWKRHRDFPQATGKLHHSDSG